MTNEYGEKLRSANVLFARAQQAARLLEEILGPSGNQVTAEWDLLGDGHGRKVVALRISDGTSAAKTELVPAEFDYQDALRVRLYHLWGGLSRNVVRSSSGNSWVLPGFATQL